MARLPNFLVIIRSEKLSGKGQGRGAKKRTFRFGKKNVSFPKVETFRFADYTGKVTISKKLKNDLMAEDEIENNSLFYMNNYTWLRVDDSFEDLIRLKILHLQ